MTREIAFKNLPFVPESKQVIYVESSYHERLNKFIRAHYHWLRKTFLKQGYEFCYLPILSKEAVNYNAPYLTDKECRAIVEKSPSLSDFVLGGEIIEPSLVFALSIPVADDEDNTVLQSVAIEPKWYVLTKHIFIRLVREIKRVEQSQIRHYREIERAKQAQISQKSEIEDNKEQPRFSLAPRNSSIRFSITEPDDADSKFDYESLKLIDEIRIRIRALRNKGVNTLFLHDIIDNEEHISRLRITKDYRIYLIDYNNMEIKLPVLTKAVFLLFLHHSEGIRFKELPDYYPELLQIYLSLKPIGGRKRQEQSIRDITNPLNNSINEKCSRIREAFIKNFDDRLAQNYYVTGKRGEPKRIALDKSKIIWE